MKFLLVLLCFALPYVVLSATDCNTSFSKYLQCIADATGDSKKGKELEQEFLDDFDKHVADCFDEADQNGKNTKCILSQANLNTDVFGPDGPLKGCDDCRKYATDAKNIIFNTSESIRTCFRVKFAAAVVNDLQPCIRTELKDQTFTIATLPDFDKSTKDFLDLALKSTSHRVMAYSRLDVCNSRYTSRAQTSGTCLDNTKGLYPKQCALSKSCKTSAIAADCADKFGKVSAATCKCLNVKRDEWHAALNKVHDAVFNDAHSSTTCSTGVKAALGHWTQDFEDILKTCVPAGGTDALSKALSLPMSKLIDAGCIQAVGAAADDTKRDQLNIGFRFIRFLLDALNDRVTRFCQSSCL
jgi:hypothetical protein